jgi:DNA repair exonuclease SbcCD ATPase subunit
LSPKFGFLKRKTLDYFQDKKSHSDSVQSITDTRLLEIIEREKNVLEEDLSDNIEPIRISVLDCLDRLRKGADELEEQEIKAENPKFVSLINTSKKILIATIRKDSFIESSELKNYEDSVRFKNNLELLINRFGQVGDSHNRILNEFMRKQINKLKNEFDNLSSLLKEVNKIFSIKETEIDRCAACQKDLTLLKEKISEREYKQGRLLELKQERQTIDKNIDASNREYEGFQKSKEFLEASNGLKNINDKKNEIGIFERNMINKVSNLSRPITKFSYLASKETQRKLATILNEPLEIFNDNHQYLELFNELKKQIVEKTIQIKDPEKTIHQIDEIVNSLPSLSSDLRKLKEDLTQLESSVNSKNMHHLDDVKNKIAMYEKYRSENIANIQETKSNIDGLDSELKLLKKKIEDNAKNITNDRYSIMRSQE